jgi:glycosyltransferase involved in cell wall biosynthesis
MNNDSLVSTIIIFLNAEDFIQEAIESVIGQTYESWELLLVDDGSTDASTEIARRFADANPRQVRYPEHPGHRNCGKGASRNLGIRAAHGDYVAFLDADDVWLPDKLARQVAILDTHQQAGMTYGNTLYWYSWTQNPADIGRDYVPPLGAQPNSLVEPPRLVPMFLRGKAAVPCTCSILVRRSAIMQINGFDESFLGPNNIYEDQAFYAKICLRYPVFVADDCLDRYRQHPGASMAGAEKMGHLITARQFFLTWLRGYLVEQGERDAEVWQALQRELWRIDDPIWLPPSPRIRQVLMWIKKWLLRVEERTLPPSVHRRLWCQQREH